MKMMMLTAALLLVSGGIVLAQDPNPPAGTVLMPYSLQGKWGTTADDNVVTPYTYCYVLFTANETSAVWNKTCLPQSGGPEIVVDTLELIAPSVVACGQNQQLGQSYGVFGGYITDPTGANLTAACVYFSRIDGAHATNGGQAVSIMSTYVPDACNSQPGKVCCDAVLPTNAVTPNVSFPLAGQYTCSSGVCNQVKLSSYCSDNNSYVIKQIGIGMSVGGIGLLLVTVALIVIISSLVQG